MKKAIINKTAILKLCLTIFVALSLFSCTRDDDSITETGRYNKDDIKSYEDLFTVFWNVMDNEYNYFYEEKERNNLDWDKLHAEYLPKFRALKTWELKGHSNDQIKEESDLAISYFEDIVNRITDRHFTLYVSFPISRTERSVNKFWGGMKEDGPLRYDKKSTMIAIKAQLEDHFWISKKLKEDGSDMLYILGGYLQSAPDTFYFSYNQFALLVNLIDLSDNNSFLFEDPASEGLINRSELEQNAALDAIKDEVLRADIRNWTLETYDVWHNALSTTLRSESLSKEVDRFNRTEEVTDALLEEASHLELYISMLPETDTTKLDNLPPDAKRYLSNFHERMKEMKTAYNLPTFIKTLGTIGYNAKIYRSFFNPLHRGEIKKLILDLRGNGGGVATDARFFVERLVTREALVGYQRTKEGNGRFNYTPWVPMHTKPHPFAIPNAIPIVILTDYGSVSMSELTTMTLKTQDMVKSVGDYTRGGTAGLGRDDDFNGGTQVKIGKYMKFYMPLMATKDASGNVIEGIGVKPDVYVAPPSEEEIKDMEINPEHNDRTLNKAIDVISSM